MERCPFQQNPLLNRPFRNDTWAVRTNSKANGSVVPHPATWSSRNYSNFDRGHPVVLILTVSLHIVQPSDTTYKLYVVSDG